MTIRKDERSGLWRDDVTTGHKLNKAGNKVPIRKTFYGHTKKEVQQKIDDFKAKQRAGLESKTQYFGILADGWIKEFFAKDGSLKDSTKQLYIDAWNRHIKTQPFYYQQLDEITAKTLQKAYNDLGDAEVPASSIKAAHNLMKRFYKYIESEELGRNVTSSITLPKVQTGKANDEIVVWTDEEIRTILRSFDHADPRFRLRFLIVLAYFTGCRKGELLGLTYDDFTDDGLRITKTLGSRSELVDGKMKATPAITEPKTKSSFRTIPLDPIVLEELKKHRAWHLEDQLKHKYRTNNVFTTESGAYYDRWNVDAALARYYKNIGIEPKSMHTYRHTFGTNLCKNGIPIEAASALMGHSSIAVTEKYYVNVSADQKKKAIEALRIALIV